MIVTDRPCRKLTEHAAHRYRWMIGWQVRHALCPGVKA